MRRYLPALALVLAMTTAATAVSAEKTIIVLDGSGSMWGQINGKTKMEIARDTLDAVLKTVPASNEIGLMVYGHREKGSCGDIELAVPPRANSADEIAAFAKSVNPKGKTPISQAVKEAAEALKFTEDKATVVLVTDGLETCEADPCAIAAALEKQGVDFTAHVVGFGLTEDEGRKVACLAENTGGTYFQASDAAQLANALIATVAAEPPRIEPEPEPEPVKEAEPEFNMVTDSVMFEGGPSLEDADFVRWDIFKRDISGNRGDAVAGNYDATLSASLEPGLYLGVAKLGAITREIAFEVTPNAVARPFVNFDAGRLKITPKRTASETAPFGDARVDLKKDAFSDGNYGEQTFFVPAGETVVTGKIGPVSVEERVAVKAGETVEHVLLIGAGKVVASAVYATGGPAVESGDLRFDVLAAKKDIQGNRAEIVGNYGAEVTLDVPAGDYVLRARLGGAMAETPFTSKVGESVAVSVNIEAGVLAITAPGARRIDILAARKDIQGNQPVIANSYEANFQTTLPAGDYVVRADYSDVKPARDIAVTIKAGERTETVVE